MIDPKNKISYSHLLEIISDLKGKIDELSNKLKERDEEIRDLKKKLAQGIHPMEISSSSPAPSSSEASLSSPMPFLTQHAEEDGFSIQFSVVKRIDTVISTCFSNKEHSVRKYFIDICVRELLCDSTQALQKILHESLTNPTKV